MKQPNTIVAGYRRTCAALQTGGQMLPGVRTHWDRKRPPHKRQRQSFKQGRNFFN